MARYFHITNFSLLRVVFAKLKYFTQVRYSMQNKSGNYMRVSLVFINKLSIGLPSTMIRQNIKYDVK